MKQFLRAFLLTLLILLLVIASFFSGYLVRDYRFRNLSTFPILNQAYEILLNHGYYVPPPEPALEYGMIQGMITTYGDSYTSFVEPVQHELESDSLQGTYGGIGADIGNDSMGYYVLFPYPDSPASKAGILEGDRLLQVDSTVITQDTPRDMVLAAIHGPVEERLELLISRPPQYTNMNISVTREEFPLPSVVWHLEPKESRLGVLNINIIAATTPEELETAIQDMQTRGATSFVLDLRDNYGGLLEAGIEVTELFLSSGIIIEQQYRGQPIETYTVVSPGQFSTIPLVVLVNQHTASAAEIIAGSLQHHHRAPLIGVPTYGKDTIQLVFELDDGSSLHITAAQWWFPGENRALIDHRLQPDIVIEGQETSTIDPFISAAIDHLFPNH